MKEVVLDASVVVEWFATDAPDSGDAGRFRDAYVEGRLSVYAPPLLFLELLNVAGRRWRWAEAQLLELAGASQDLGFAIREPDLVSVAEWVSRGLSSYDASYVALAEMLGRNLVTGDAEIARAAPSIAVSMAAADI